MQSPTTTGLLAAFLNQPNIETSPAWEFINGQAQQKPMPTLYHSRLKRNLVNAINSNTGLARFERATYRLGGGCSIQLSYSPRE